MNIKVVLMMIVLGVAGVYAWKSGIIGAEGGSATASVPTTGAADPSAATQKGKDLFEQYKYPAISMGIILFIIAAAWKHTPAIVKYPLMTLMFVGWVYYSSR